MIDNELTVGDRWLIGMVVIVISVFIYKLWSSTVEVAPEVLKVVGILVGFLLASLGVGIVFTYGLEIIGDWIRQVITDG